MFAKAKKLLSKEVKKLDTTDLSKQISPSLESPPPKPVMKRGGTLQGNTSLSTPKKTRFSKVKSGMAAMRKRFSPKNMKKFLLSKIDTLRKSMFILSALCMLCMFVQWSLYISAYWWGQYIPIFFQYYYIPTACTCGILVTKNVMHGVEYMKSSKGIYLGCALFSFVSIILYSVQIHYMSQNNDATWESMVEPYHHSGGYNCTDHYERLNKNNPEANSWLVTTLGSRFPDDCPCLDAVDNVDLKDLKEDFDASDEKEEDFGRDDFALESNECFVRPLFDGTVDMVKGITLTVKSNPGRIDDIRGFFSKTTFILFLDCVILAFSIIMFIVSCMVLNVYDGQSSVPIRYSKNYTKPQLMGVITAYILMGAYAVASVMGCMAIFSGFYIDLRLQCMLFVPVLVAGMMMESPEKSIRGGAANEEYYAYLKYQVLYMLENSMVTDEHVSETLTRAESDSLPAIVDYEKRHPKYREYYGAVSKTYIMVMVSSILTFTIGLYGMIECLAVDAVSTGEIRVPHSDIVLYLDTSEHLDYSESYVKGLQTGMGLVTYVVTMLGGGLMSASMIWRLVVSERNWKQATAGKVDFSGMDHNEIMDYIGNNGQPYDGFEDEVMEEFTGPMSVESKVSFSHVHRIKKC